MMKHFGLRYFLTFSLVILGCGLTGQPSGNDTHATSIAPLSRRRPADAADHREADRRTKRARERYDGDVRRAESRSKRSRTFGRGSDRYSSRRERDRDRVETIAEDEDTCVLRCTYSCRNPLTGREEAKTELVILNRLEGSYARACDFNNYANVGRVNASNKRNQDFKHKVIYLVEEPAKRLMTKHADKSDPLRIDCRWGGGLYKSDSDDNFLVAVEVTILPDRGDLTVQQARKKKKELVRYYEHKENNCPGCRTCRRRPEIQLGAGLWAVGTRFNRDGKQEIYHRAFHYYDAKYYKRLASDTGA